MAPWPMWMNLGVPNMGGAAVTASGVVFIGATTDNFLRAFDIRTGRELWKGRLPAGGQALPMSYVSARSGKQFVVDRGNRDNRTDACTLNGSADKLGLADAVGRKAGGKVGVFFLGHASLDNTAAMRRVILFAGHWLHLLSLIAVFGANLHPITGSNSQGFSKTESPLLYNFCFLRLPDVLGTRFTPAIY